jgi:lipopolysaccharide/colanic/teichoic acid biosynthesis glycosyltransferase
LTPEPERLSGGADSPRPGLPRGADVLLSALGLVVTSPILALSAAAIALTSRGPVLFRQLRVGRDGEPFTLVKFRTMRSSPGRAVTARDDPRITRVGRLLRRTKLDELPELWNVLRGEMSLVGPRPEVPELVDRESPVWREILRVRPGVTDPVTLQLRDEESLMAGVSGDRDRYYREVLQPRKLSGYRDYLRRRTWRSDARVLLETGVAVLLPPLARKLHTPPGVPRSLDGS